MLENKFTAYNFNPTYYASNSYTITIKLYLRENTKYTNSQLVFYHTHTDVYTYKGWCVRI